MVALALAVLCAAQQLKAAARGAQVDAETGAGRDFDSASLGAQRPWRALPVKMNSKLEHLSNRCRLA